MSDRPERSGPVMLVATEALKPPELRIGKIGENFTLPRTVRVASLVAAGLGGFVGLVFVSVFVGMSIKSVSYSFVVGAMLGTAVVSYSPLRGESLGRWVLLRLRSRRHRVDREGRPVRLAVGICYVEPVFDGPVRLVGGAAAVRPGQVDDRFAFVVDPGRRLNARQRLGLQQLPGEVDDDVLDKPRRGRHIPVRADATVEPSRSSRSLSLAGFRAAADEQAELDRAAPRVRPSAPVKMAARSRHGRWTQDHEQLAALYAVSGAVNDPVGGPAASPPTTDTPWSQAQSDR